MIGKIASISLIGFTSIGIYKYSTEPQFGRTLTLWSRLGPIITHYRLIELKHKILPVTDKESESEYHKLHLMYSYRVMETFRDLRGFYIKVGQILANRSDMLPEIYIEQLRLLEDQVPHLLNGVQAQELICRDLNLRKLSDVFVDFEDEPIGSASIGQVHKARLLDGQTVAIKIQAPGTEQLFRDDITASRDFCRLFAPEQVIIFDEIENQFVTEFDYRLEASNLARIYVNMKSFRNVVVPKPYLDISSKHVLVMEFLRGKKLVDGMRENATEYAALLGKTYKQLEGEMRRDFNANGLPPIYDGPSANSLEIYRTLMIMKDNLMNSPIWVINKSINLLNSFVKLVSFSKPPLPIESLRYYKSFIPLNSSFIMSTLLEAHGHQLLINGFFNADPHPGNFLLMDDGRIAMLDYGQVKTLTNQQRLDLANIIIAVTESDRDTIYKINVAAGYKSKNMDKEVMFNMCRIAFDQDGRVITGGLNLQQYVDSQYCIDPWESTDPNVIMPMRLSLLLRGVGLMINHPVSVCTAWKDFAKRAVKMLSDEDGLLIKSYYP